MMGGKMNYIYTAAEIEGPYRWTLRRCWDETKPVLVACGLNPSKADGKRDDHTLRRWVSFADRDGFGSLWVVNAYPWRATHQADLREALALHGDAGVLGPLVQNMKYWHKADEVLCLTCRDRTVLLSCGDPGAWGRGRVLDVIDIVRSVAEHVVCLGRTKNGMPRHPARLRSDTPMEAW